MFHNLNWWLHPSFWSYFVLFIFFSTILCLKNLLELFSFYQSIQPICLNGSQSPHSKEHNFKYSKTGSLYYSALKSGGMKWFI